MRTIDLTGGVALVTPFHHDRSVDYEGLQKIILNIVLIMKEITCCQ